MIPEHVRWQAGPSRGNWRGASSESSVAHQRRRHHVDRRRARRRTALQREQAASRSAGGHQHGGRAQSPSSRRLEFAEMVAEAGHRTGPVGEVPARPRRSPGAIRNRSWFSSRRAIRTPSIPARARSSGKAISATVRPFIGTTWRCSRIRRFRRTRTCSRDSRRAPMRPSGRSRSARRSRSPSSSSRSATRSFIRRRCSSSNCRSSSPLPETLDFIR